MGLTSILCAPLALSNYKVGVGPGSEEVLPQREVDQGREGSCLGQQSGDAQGFPNMSRKGWGPGVGGQGWFWLIHAPDVGRPGLGWSTRQRAATHEKISTAQLVPSLSPPPTPLTSDCSFIGLSVWMKDQQLPRNLPALQAPLELLSTQPHGLSSYRLFSLSSV